MPAWFTACLLWTCGLCLLLIGLIDKKNETKHFKYWIVLGVIFFFLSLDETISVHEWLTLPVKSFFSSNIVELTGFFRHAWVIPFGAMLLLLLFLYIPFLMSLEIKIRKLFCTAGIVYVFGAIGLEMVAGAVHDEVINLNYEIIYPLEELCEMLGVLIFLHGLTAILISKQQ